jgi:hypothetical protein
VDSLTREVHLNAGENQVPFPNVLTQFKPGQSGNPKGRKKGLMTLIKEALERDEIAGQKTPDGRSVIEHYAEAIIAHGMKGNAAYMTQVFDRLEGKVGAEIVDEEQRKAMTPVVILPAKEMHATGDQTPAGATDSISGE